MSDFQEQMRKLIEENERKNDEKLFENILRKVLKANLVLEECDIAKNQAAIIINTIEVMKANVLLERISRQLNQLLTIRELEEDK